MNQSAFEEVMVLLDSNAHFGGEKKRNRDESASTQTHLYIMVVIIGDGQSMENKITFPVHELEEGGQGVGGSSYFIHYRTKQSARCDHCQVLECFITALINSLTFKLYALTNNSPCKCNKKQ